MSHFYGTTSYWNNRYENRTTGWDIGHVSTPIQDFFQQLPDKNLNVLVPGAGNGWEVEYLYHQGFQNVHYLDFSASAGQNFKRRVPYFPGNQVYIEDFFKHEGQYDVIVEQTFFSAIPVHKRGNYVDKVHQLLVNEGRIVGLLFGIPMFADHPPFGGSIEEYTQLFSEKFDLKVLDWAYNSIKPRRNSELFIHFIRK